MQSGEAKLTEVNDGIVLGLVVEEFVLLLIPWHGALIRLEREGHLAGGRSAAEVSCISRKCSLCRRQWKKYTPKSLRVKERCDFLNSILYGAQYEMRPCIACTFVTFMENAGTPSMTIIVIIMIMNTSITFDCYANDYLCSISDKLSGR